ncbi:hypothetical protein [Duganella vulcania]|uniref:Uncharacterized protein n=1 Tax=Duganella vulcania TaxID=2692166 RepID=A0A845GCY9_9BURK|nr:hypothetical protein [Duganella vulcania]MYM92483.1 hypothetical protein [Duganella vulcania]
MTDQNKPLCKVHGMIEPGAMCSSVIVGAKYCGYAGKCEHKVTAAQNADSQAAQASHKVECRGNE